ncbi:MAG TPA: ATP-binding protein [Prolixibacteraceae bacterium]
MVFKTDIEQAYQLQQANLLQKDELITRAYMQKMNSDLKHVEVVSGVRRCGKSTFLKQIMLQYAEFAYFNFEDSRIFGFEVSDFQKLDEVIGSGKMAYFFDEIQNVEAWEIFVRQLHDRGEKVYITGSNASLLSKELGTRLTGRHIGHELFPFSYPEYLLFKGQENNSSSFEEYLQKGGFPEYLNFEKTEVLQNLLKDIVFRDIAIRYNIKNTRSLMDITLFLISNVGKEFTFNSIRNTFSIGSANTVSDYLAWLQDSYLFFFLPRFSWSPKSSAMNPRKVYAIDNGMVNANSLSFSKDTGRLLENAVFLHLRRIYSSIFYFREKGECDFVVFKNDQSVILLQVCLEVHGENKDREINGLVEALEFFKLSEGTIVTLNQTDTLVVNSKKINLIPGNIFMTLE